MLGCFFSNPTHYADDSRYIETTTLAVKYGAKWRKKLKRMYHFRRLDTIMEATQREESDNGDCFHLELSQKSSNGRDSVDVKNMQDFETSRPTEIVLSSRRICRSGQRRHQRSSTPPNSVSSTGCPFRFKDHNSEMTQKDNRNACDLRQIEVLFPEFFSGGAGSSFIYQRNWDEANHQNNTTLVNEKIKEDPFIRPWLNLFGACSYT